MSSAESMAGGGEEAEPGFASPAHDVPSPSPAESDVGVSHLPVLPSPPPLPSADVSTADSVHPTSSSHRPPSIVTGHRRPSPALPLRPLPPPASSAPTLDHLEALVSALPSSLPEIPLPPPPPYSEADAASSPLGRWEEEKGKAVVMDGSTPPPVISIHYAEDAEDGSDDEESEAPGSAAAAGPVGGRSLPTAYEYPEVGGEGGEASEEEKQKAGELEAARGYGGSASITGTTVPFQSAGTFVPDGLGRTFDSSAPCSLDGDGTAATLRSSIGSTTTPSPLPYNTASSLALLASPTERPLSPSAHSTPEHLRPSSALSLYSPPAVDDVHGTMKSAVSVLSYDDGDMDGAEAVEGADRGLQEGHSSPLADYPRAAYQGTASYQYEDADESKEGEREEVQALAVAEEKEEQGEAAELQVVRVDGGEVDEVHRAAFHASSDIELARSNSRYADHFTHSGVQSVKVEDGVTGGVLAQVQSAFKVDVKVHVQGRHDGVNENPEGRRRPREPRKTFRWPLFCALFLTLDTLLFLVPLAWGGWSFASLFDNPMFGPDGSALLHFGAKFTPALLVHGQSWRLLASCFLHAGIIHIIFSLTVGLVYGWSLEQEYGWYRVLPIWLVSGVFSQLFSALLSPQLVSVGGGAALAGVVGSWLADFCHTHERIVGKWSFFARNAFSSALIFASGVFPFVDNWGLGSGAVMGFVLGLVLYAPLHKTREGRWKLHHPLLAVPAAVLVLLMFAVVTGVLYSQSSSSASTYDLRGNAHSIGCVDTPYWSCHSGVPLDCYNAQGVFQPGSGGAPGNTTTADYSGYC